MNDTERQNYIRNTTSLFQLTQLIRDFTWYQGLRVVDNKNGKSEIIVSCNKMADAKELSCIPREINGLKIRILFKPTLLQASMMVRKYKETNKIDKLLYSTKSLPPHVRGGWSVP